MLPWPLPASAATTSAAPMAAPTRCASSAAAGRQRCRCGAYRRPGAAVRERALRKYTEGSSLRAGGRIWSTAPPAVLGRVKKGPPGPEPAAGAEPAAHRGEGGPSADGSDCLGMRCGPAGERGAGRSGRAAGSGRRRRRRRTAAAGWTLRRETAARRPPCVCTKGCLMLCCTAAMPIRCTGPGRRRNGTRRGGTGR